VGAIDERQLLDEHAGELAAILLGVGAVADLRGLAPQQLEHDGPRRLRPLGRVGLEHAPDELGDHRPGLLQQRAGELGPPVPLGPERLAEALARERTLAPDRRVDRRGQGVDVRARVGELSPELLGRGETRGPEHGDALVVVALGDRDRGGRLAEHPRQAEVDELGLRRGIALTARDEHVRRLDVAVHEAERVDVVERAGQLQELLHDLLARGPVEVAAELVAAHQLLREVEAVGVGTAAEVVHRRQVRVVELGEDPVLLLERRGEIVPRGVGAETARHRASRLDPRVLCVAAVRRAKPRPSRGFPPDELERDHAILELVERLVHRTEAAAAEQTAHLVAARDLLGGFFLPVEVGVGLQLGGHRRR